MTDSVNHPKHYCSHPSGVEAITVAEHMNFCVGNAMKYLWRAGLKTPDPLDDLRKAAWYIAREIERLEKQAAKTARCAERFKVMLANEDSMRDAQELDRLRQLV